MRILYFALLLTLSTTIFSQYEIQTKNLTDIEEHKVVVVQEGDTLWDLCEQYLGDPFLWPKIWSLNPEIENPHIIEPGDKVHFYPRSGRVEIEPKNVNGNATNINSSEAVTIDQNSSAEPIQVSSHTNSSLSRRYSTGRGLGLVAVRNEAIITSKKFKKSGKIDSTKEENLLLTINDSVYLKFKAISKVKKGDIYHIYSVRERLKHPTKEEAYIGYLVDILGEIKIVGKTKKYAVGKIVKAFVEIERGNYVIPKVDLSYSITPKNSSKKIEGKIVQFAKDVDNFGSSQLIFIDKGKIHGVQKGMVFNVLRDRDPITNKKTPRNSIGKVIIISTTKETAAAFVVSTKEEIMKGYKVSTEKKLY